MCARYVFQIDDPENESIVREINRRYGQETVKASLPQDGLIVPSRLAPVLSRDRHGQYGYFLMNFGFRLYTNMIINARAETVTQKPLFRSLVAERRCLIPANQYTEWQHEGKARIPYQFTPSASGRMFFAGLYRIDPGQHFASFVILTRNAASDFAHIHDRMPLILSPEEQLVWLNPTQKIDNLLASGMVNLTWQQSASA